MIYTTEVTNEWQGIKINGYTNRWSAFEKAEIDGGGIYYIFENDSWGDETCYLVAKIENNVIVELYETYDNIIQCLLDEQIINENEI